MNVAAKPSDLLATRPDTIRLRSEAQARRIADDVVAGIAAGTLKPGDRLPDERSLCQRYATGRHTVRKAMDTLERQNLVGRFVGRGSFVLHPTPQATGPRDSWTLLELTEARLVLEPGVAALAAQRADAADLLRLDRDLAAIADAATWRGFKEAKYAFHRTIAEIARNGFVCDIFDRIIASRRLAWGGYVPQSPDLAAARADCLAESRAIRAMIGQGDAEGSAAAVRRSVTRLLVNITAS